MSLAEGTELLLSTGDLPSWSYLRDMHFHKYLLKDINSLDDAEAFLVRLDKDNEDHTQPGPFRWGCTKAKGIREWLKKDFWRESTSRIRQAIAANRRTCCSCHEVGSFKRRDQLPVTHQEHKKASS